MSLQLLFEMTEELPAALRGQVVGYAESVRASVPAIAHELKIRNIQTFEDRLVFLAGVKKLYSITASAFWSLDNSASLLARSDTTDIVVAGRLFSRGSAFHQELDALLRDLQRTLAEQGAWDVMQLGIADLAKEIADGLA